MHTKRLLIRPADITELDALNGVIEAAVMSWDLPERVKRLSLPSYRYDAMDFKALHLLVATEEGAITGVAAWENADPQESPEQAEALLLHGLYVAPSRQRRGIGRRLFQAVEETARSQGYGGMLVKAQKSANGFFRALGMHPLLPTDPDRQYAHRFWKRYDR